jgi:hypothetical protein
MINNPFGLNQLYVDAANIQYVVFRSGPRSHVYVQRDLILNIFLAQLGMMNLLPAHQAGGAGGGGQAGGAGGQAGGVGGQAHQAGGAGGQAGGAGGQAGGIGGQAGGAGGQAGGVGGQAVAFPGLIPFVPNPVVGLMVPQLNANGFLFTEQKRPGLGKFYVGWTTFRNNIMQAPFFNNHP